MNLSPALVRELAAGRSRFNAQVSEAQRARTSFDTEAFGEAVRMRLDPLAAAVEAIAPDRTGLVVETGVALNLVLVSHALAGERRALVDRVWREAAPPLACAVAERPEPVLAMLTNAVLTLAATRGARPGEWIERMAGLASHLTADRMEAAGQVVAWRSGMAHYRQSALAAADTLPEALALAAIGATGDWPSVRAALAADRWWTPDGRADAGIRFGGFVGFGGPFEAPPEVRAGAGGFLVRSAERVGLLVADAWGATLHPAEMDEFDGALSGTPQGNGIRRPGEAQAAVSDDSVAIASPFSHFVEVKPWPA